METTRDGILVRVRRVLIDSLSLNIDEDDLQYSESLDQVIGLDSLAVLEFTAALEKEFGITIEQEKLELSLLRDLPALADYIQSLSAAPPASDTPA
jgi:acyl carrier protein